MQLDPYWRWKLTKGHAETRPTGGQRDMKGGVRVFLRLLKCRATIKECSTFTCSISKPPCHLITPLIPAFLYFPRHCSLSPFLISFIVLWSCSTIAPRSSFSLVCLPFSLLIDTSIWIFLYSMFILSEFPLFFLMLMTPCYDLESSHHTLSLSLYF